MTYEQINEMMQEMELPFAYHHYAEGESPEPPFLLFLSPPEKIHFRRIIPCISALKCWILNSTQM